MIWIWLNSTFIYYLNAQWTFDVLWLFCLVISEGTSLKSCWGKAVSHSSGSTLILVQNKSLLLSLIIPWSCNSTCIYIKHGDDLSLRREKPQLTLPMKFTSYQSVQSFGHVWLVATPWTVAHQASLSISNTQNLLKLMSIESVMPSNHLILCHPLLLLPSISSQHQGLS